MRKTKLLFVSFLFLAFGFTQAQENTELGVRLGANLSKVSGVSAKNKFGITADAFLRFKLGENFKVQTELGYSGNGFKSKEGKSVRFNYLNFAPIAKIYLDEAFSIEAGPRLSYRLSTSGIPKSSIKRLDFGATAGVAYEIAEGLEINARYNLGLRKIAANNIKNRGFQVGLSLIL